MKLPGGDRAVVDATKVRDYLLAPDHPIGRAKADRAGALYQRRAYLVLPIRARQAAAHETIFYSRLAREIGIPNERNLDDILGAIGTSLDELSHRWTAVEVKSLMSDEAHLIRGVFQCVKYAAVLDAVSRARHAPVDVHVVLGLEGTSTAESRLLATTLGVEVRECIRKAVAPTAQQVDHS